MPSPLEQTKYREQVENNIALRAKMQRAFVMVEEALRNASLGSLESFNVTIDGVNIRYDNGGEMRINDIRYSDCEPKLRKQGYDRLEKFMEIALERYNNEYNL
jgi:hypothetical protein